jgi:hypothetical protein
MRNRRNSAAPWLALAAAALGMAQSQPPKPDEKPASVEGEVRNSVTGMPIERAHVSLRRYNNNGFDRYGAMTNGEGKFRITGIPAGAYQFAPERVGYVASPEALRTSVMLRPDEKKDNFKLTLVPVGTISGRVLDADGQPADALSVQTEQGGRPVRTGMTDDRGQYRIGGLRPGKYRVRAITRNLPIPPEIRTDGTTEVLYADTYHPGALDEKGATRVTVGPASDVTGIDIRLVRTPIVRLAGKVSGMPEGAKNVYLHVQRGNGGQGTQGAQVKPDGTFEIWRLDPGKYTLRATCNNSGEMMASGAVEVEVGDSDVDNIGLTLLTAEEIRGQLEFEDEAAKQGLPAPRTGGAQGGPGGTPQAPPPRPQRRILLRDLGHMGQPMGDVSEDGAFTIPKVPPGKYEVSVMGYVAYVKSVRVGDAASDGPLLNLNHGSGGARLTVTLSSAYGEIGGTVRDDKGPVAGARVGLWGTTGVGTTYFASQADGTYSMKSVAPGTYKLMVLDEGEMDMITSDQGPDESDERVETVEVRPRETVTRDLKLRAVK